METLQSFETRIRPFVGSSVMAELENVSAHRKRFRDFSVLNGGGRNPYLLTEQINSAKLAHNGDHAHLAHVEQVVMYLLPHRLSGLLNVCPWATRGCKATCLHTSGRLGMPAASLAKFVRTQFLALHPVSFFVVLFDEIARHERRVNACNKSLVIRLNGTSDIPWETLAPFMFETFAHLQFQDYTKSWETRTVLPPNYYLVRSVSERTTTAQLAQRANENVVAVVNVRRGVPLPASFLNRPVIDGDAHDLRVFDDQRGAAVLVRAKGDAINTRAYGFVRDVSE
jgi:hypothetical protein